LVVVEGGGEGGVGLTNLVEEPGVESDRVLGIERAGVVGLEVEGEGEELGVFGDVDWHRTGTL
jgi:hypothetical protein